jgi:hypothetical protein
MPAHVVPGLFHKRGVIGSPRKPDTENMRRRADGSQFYIVSGRTYTDEELNQIEKENNFILRPSNVRYIKQLAARPTSTAVTPSLARLPAAWTWSTASRPWKLAANSARKRHPRQTDRIIE